MLRQRVCYTLALLGGLVFYCFYREWFSWFLLVLLLGLPWFSLICSLGGICTARCVIQCPQTVALGQKNPVLLSALCPLPAPPFRGKLRLTHSITGQTLLLRPGSLLPTHVCGQVRIEVVKPRITDYLGVFRLPMRQCGPVIVTVYPLPVAMKTVPDFHRNFPGQWKPRPGGGLCEVDQLRPYRPGDNLQQIHWKLSAKSGSLMYREAMEPVCQRMVLTMDLEGSSNLLNRKLGLLLWLGTSLIQRQTAFDLAVLTGSGIQKWQIETDRDLGNAMTELLGCPQATGGSLGNDPHWGSRRFHIGGDEDEA